MNSPNAAPVPIQIHVEDELVDDHYDGPEEYAQINGTPEGGEFVLMRVTVHAQTTYRMVDGKPVPVSIAFPERVRD